MKYVALLAALLTPTCHAPSPQPPDVVTDGGLRDDAARPGGTCSAACANLVELHCADLDLSSCTSACIHARDSKLVDLSPARLACLAGSTNKTTARECGGVACR